MSTLINAEHPYYATHGNYFSNDHHERFASWAEYLAEWGDEDDDMNLVYRWDWSPPEPARAYHELSIFMIQQRKARCCSQTIIVKPEDEAAVREWLEPRWEKMRALWAPISAVKP